MSYIEALKAAGAEVHCHEYFGSYQGDIWVKVTYNGVTGWVCIAYGSCSGCDNYEATFNYDVPTAEQLAAFGKGLLDDVMSQESAIKRASRHADWDDEAGAMVKFIMDNK